MAFIKVEKTPYMNLKLLLVFVIVSALIFPIAASGQADSQETDQSESSKWDASKEMKLIRVIGGHDSELFSEPTDIAIGESGNIYVADYGNKRIQILDSLGQLIQTIELKGSPHGITVDKDENIYVTEWWDFIGVEKFTKTGEPATDFQIKDQSVFGLPADVVLDSDGTLYILEHRNLDIDYGENAGIHKINADGSYLDFIPLSDGIDDKSRFTLMTIDPLGYLYIVDQSGNDIIILDTVEGKSRAIALVNFYDPSSITFGPNGYLFVAENPTNTKVKSIHVFDEYQQYGTTIGEGGSADGKISDTHGLEFDKDGNMYVVDFVDNRIQVFHLSPKVFGIVSEETEGSTPTSSSYSPSGDDLVAVLNTGEGKIVIEFFNNDAPGHVQNFISLTENDWYKTTLFHRIIKDFMIQGGDPNTKPEPGNSANMWGAGDPGYSIDAEFNSIKHERGIVSMARSSDPDSAGSQFFIVHKDSTHLDGKYTVFGRLITSESYETLDKIANLEVNSKDQPISNSLPKALVFDVDIVPRSSIEDVLTMDPPNRFGFTPEVTEKIKKFTNEEFNFSVNTLEGWSIIEPVQFDDNTPVYLAIGPIKDGIAPHIYINVIDFPLTDSTDTFSYEQILKTYMDSRIKNNHEMSTKGELELKTEKISRFYEGHFYEITATQYIEDDMTTNEPYLGQLKQLVFATPTHVFGITYTNLESNFNEHIDLVNQFKYSFTTDEIILPLDGIDVTDSNIQGKFYNNEEYQFRFEIPYRWDPLLPKTFLDETGFKHYLLAVEPGVLHVNYYKDGVQARFLVDILNADEFPFEKYSSNIYNYYQALERNGSLSIADEYIGTTTDGHPVHFTEYLEPYETVKGTTIAIHTRETIVANSDFVYKISYVNLNDNFPREISSYNYLLEHFKFSFDGEMKSIDWGPNIIKYNPVGEPGGGGCLIATAAFGSEIAPQVQFLRELRDNTVLQTESGTSFMAGFNQFYYSFSPAIADYERENPVFKEAVKLTLTPLLTSLTLLQYTDIDSESEMLGYGIGIILLNIGMYFVAPAILIMKIRTSYNKIPKNI